MAPAFDSSLMFRTTGTLTQDESLGPITVYGGQAKGLAVRVVVPQGYGANDTVLPKVHISTDGSNYNLVAQHNKGAQKPGTTGLDLIVPIPLQRGKNYVKLELDVTVASTTPNFGTVVAGIIENPGQDWDRSTLPAFH